MNKILMIALVFVTLTMHAQGIEFEKVEWREALAKAKAEEKILFVDAYTTWCGPCKKMAKYEFTKKEVGDFFNENFINLKLNMESKDGKRFDAQYPVSAYPTMLFLDAEGNIIERIVGARPGKALIESGKKALKRVDFSTKYEERYAKGERSYDLVYKYVKALNASNKSSLKVANDFLNNAPDISPEQRSTFIFEAATESDSRIYKMMIDDKTKIQKLVGEEAFHAQVLKACQKTVEKAIEYEETFLLDEAISTANRDLPKKEAGMFSSDMKMKYALAFKDEKLYDTALDKALDIFDDDLTKKKLFMNQILEHFDSNDGMVAKALDISKIVFKKEPNYPNAVNTAMILKKMGKSKKAKKFLKKAMKKHDFTDSEIHMLKELMKTIHK